MVRTRKYYLKNNYLTEVKVSQRSIQYATYRLMVMHPHTKYNELSGKTKKLWSGQASPKRNERRKNQTKTKKRKKKKKKSN